MRAATVTVTFSPIQAGLLQCYADRHHAGSLDAATCALAVAGLRDQLARDDALCDAWGEHLDALGREIAGWDHVNFTVPHELPPLPSGPVTVHITHPAGGVLHVAVNPQPTEI
jgi:hypothetical protein